MTYNRAIKALASHPEPFEHPKDCIEVKGIGPKIVKLLTENVSGLRYIEYRIEQTVDGETKSNRYYQSR